MERTRVLIADDHRVVVEGVRGALEGHPQFEVVGEAYDGQQALELVKSLQPDLVIMDIGMPNLDGIEATRLIKRSNSNVGVVIFSMYSDREFVVDLFREGISAYVLKDDPLSDLVLALEAVRRGGTYFSSKAPTVLVRHLEELEQRVKHGDPFKSLSQREREVFLPLAEGKSIKSIAEQLFISPKTVESHKHSIMEKLQAGSLADLTRIAIRKNLIKP